MQGTRKAKKRAAREPEKGEETYKAPPFKGVQNSGHWGIHKILWKWESYVVLRGGNLVLCYVTPE